MRVFARVSPDLVTDSAFRQFCHRQRFSTLAVHMRKGMASRARPKKFPGHFENRLMFFRGAVCIACFAGSLAIRDRT